MIKITLLLCLITVCLSERDIDYTNGMMDTIELRSNDDKEKIDFNYDSYHHFDHEKRSLIQLGSSGLSDLSSILTQLTNKLDDTTDSVTDLVNLLPVDDTILGLKSTLLTIKGVLATVVGLLLDLLGLLLSLVAHLLDITTKLTTQTLDLSNVVGTLLQQTNALTSLVGQVSSITDKLSFLVGDITLIKGQLVALLSDINDLSLKSAVQDLITKLDLLTTNLGSLLAQLINAVLTLVAQILAALTEPLTLVQQITDAINNATGDVASNLVSLGRLNSLLGNLTPLVNSLLSKLQGLTDVTGIDLGQLVPLNDLLTKLTTLRTLLGNDTSGSYASVLVNLDAQIASLTSAVAGIQAIVNF